ncbi:MAG: PD40 domain-containing protein, partial [Nanoarchaeota archaeon]|nr:PD40 domain-containing protein [Nanoarchaeota archaeon]
PLNNTEIVMNEQTITCLLAVTLILGCTQQLQETSMNFEHNIVFMSRADSQAGELYYYNATSQEIIRLTNNDRHENNPALSRDGRYVAFHAGDEANPLTWEIYYIDLQTMQEYQVTENNLLDGHPDWSPDGEKIVYASFQNSEGGHAGTGDVFIVNRNGTNKVRLTNTEDENNDPEWSPDGTMIAFKSTRRKNETFQDEVYVMNSDGTDVKQITTTAGWNSDHDVSWSPDSKNLVFTRYQGSIPWVNIADIENFQTNYPQMTPWNCFRADLNGDVEQLTYSEDLSAFPVYSPNNDKIMYIDYEPILINNIIMGFEHKLTIIKTDGTSPEVIMQNNKYTPTLEYYDW